MNVRCLSKIIPKNLILLISSIVADVILILVKSNSFLYEKIIYFVLSALIQIRFDDNQLLALLRSWLRVNVNSMQSVFFMQQTKSTEYCHLQNSINLNKDDEFGRTFINITVQYSTMGWSAESFKILGVWRLKLFCF